MCLFYPHLGSECWKTIEHPTLKDNFQTTFITILPLQSISIYCYIAFFASNLKLKATRAVGDPGVRCAGVP